MYLSQNNAFLFIIYFFIVLFFIYPSSQDTAAEMGRWEIILTKCCDLQIAIFLQSVIDNQ